MAYVKDSFATILSRIFGDIAARLQGTQPQLKNVVSAKTGQKRRSLLNITGYVLAGIANAFQGKLKKLYDQILPDTQASDMLTRNASLWLPGGRKQATSAIGNLLITGANGIDIPLGTEVIRADGVLYASTADVVIVGGGATIPLQAVAGGVDGNADPGTSLTFVAPIAGVTSAGSVDGTGLNGGNDVESDAALRARLIFRMQRPPRAGTVDDYIIWATDQPGVTRVWVTPLALGPNQVSVRYVNDALPNPVPTGGAIAIIQAAIDALRPLTSQATVLAPITDATSYSIHLVPNNADTQAAVTASLAQMHLKLASVGGCKLPTGGTGGTLDLSDIRQAVKTADGVTDYTITLINGAAPANIVSASGHLAVPGVITWV